MVVSFISMSGGAVSRHCAEAQSHGNQLCKLSTNRMMPSVSRREFNNRAASALFGGLFMPFLFRGVNEVKAQEKGQLPDGARQFSQVITAQKQWNSVKDVFNDGHELSEEEWKNLRTYLRMVYAVSGDMDFLTRRWEKTRRESGQATISEFRKTIKTLDTPAYQKDIPAFLEGHKQVANLFTQFFDVLKQDTIGDMPEDL